ncbi:type II secretion system F family protein [bacterium]|nr:type II secretion system F family protein [candidate division CSSED10-310 bacterium]
MKYGFGFQRELIAFLRSAAALVQAGIPVDEVLRECLDQAHHRSMEQVIAGILKKINEGYSLAGAMKNREDLIPPVVVAIVRSGESAGSLASALDHAADQLEHQVTARAEIWAVLIYPAAIIGMSLAAVIFLSISVLPQVSGIYSSAGAHLPVLTRMVIVSGKILIWILAGCFVLAGCLAMTPLRPHARRLLAAVPARMPFLWKCESARRTWLWSQMLGTMTSRNIPLQDALEIAAGSSRDDSLQRMFDRILVRINEGMSPAEAFRTELQVPSLARRMIASGDRAGNLPEAFRQVSGFYQMEYRIRSRRIIAMAEPAAIMAAGMVVLLIAAAVILPLIDLGDLVR